MNRISARMQSWLIWLLPFAVLAVIIAWEADWGRKWRHVPATDAVVVPQPVTIAVLPEYKPVATLATQRDMVERALFNPTRRPAPIAPAEAAKKRLQPGQFMLTGTLLIDGKAIAFLRENAGGKSRRVSQGEQINGMMVSEVKPDRIKLTLGEESEDLLLKVATGPKTTIQPVAAVATQAAGGVAGFGPQAGTPGQNSADVLAERRRVQQAAEAAAAAGGRSAPAILMAPPPGAYLPPGGTSANADKQAVDPRWAESDARVRARQPGAMKQ